MTMGRTKPKKPTVPTKSKLKKDPGVPRLTSLKVRHVEKSRLAPSQAALERRDDDSFMASEPTLSTLAENAQAQQYSEASIPGDDDPGVGSSTGQKSREQMRRYYVKTLHKVIDQSDIVILVLDARDPEGCRSRLVEEEVRRREAEGKRLVFVLNKIDLIPKENAQAWLKYLRHSTPTLPFKCSNSSVNTKTTNTAPTLLKLLKAYKPKAGSVTVGVVGFPNVGKSSLINSLKRSKVCAVAAQPGHTKELQSIQLERGIKVVDSPGVVFDDDDEDMGDGKSRQKSSVLLRNVVKTEDIVDPIEVVEEILHRTPIEAIQRIYNLPAFNSTLEFLTMFALSNGRLLKGGTPDLLSSARVILNDWNHQKIPYHSEPPTVHPSSLPTMVSNIIAPGAENVGQAQIVTEFSKPFVLDGLFDSGAFKSTSLDDAAMMDEDGDVFYDAVEDDGTRMEGLEMAQNPTPSPSNPLKRYRSPSVLDGDAAPAQQDRYVRQPKRLRRNKEIPEYNASVDSHSLKAMGKSNPLNRRSVKQDKKRARKAAQRAAAKEETGGMEVDDVGGLGDSFMV